MKKLIAIIMSVVLVSLVIPEKCYADNIYTVKVPIDASVILKGALLTTESVMLEEPASGRIHDMARAATGKLAGYRYYVVSDLSGMDDLQVYDNSNALLVPVLIDMDTRLIVYQSTSENYMTAVSERVRGAAIAYHNRTGGYGTTTFYQYFMSGSEAAQKCELSDNGRYWGQYVTAKIISSVEVLDVVSYGENAFTAKARIVAGGAGYTEDYTISFLFQNAGRGFYVTKFTMMK